MAIDSERTSSPEEAFEPAPYVGVDYYFRTELAIGLGAAHDANFGMENAADSSDEKLLEAFVEGAEWTVWRARSRVDGSNPSRRAQLENTIWNIFGSEEQMAFMLDRFRKGEFFVHGAGQRIFLIGDEEAFVLRDKQPA